MIEEQSIMILSPSSPRKQRNMHQCKELFYHQL